MRDVPHILLAALLAIGTLACSEPESPVASGSQVVAGSYTNEYFGLTLSIPDGWFVASEDTAQFMRETGEDVAIGDDATLKAAVEASKKTTFQLLTLSEFEMGAAVEFNPNLILMAERVSHVPGIKSGGDYLFHTSKMLLRTQLPYELTKESYPTQLGGREWYRADFIIAQPEMPIEQSYFAAKQEDWVLVIILSAATQEQMVALEGIADSISL
jgi:hypothetical protein